MTKLKPCPFCGLKPKLITFIGGFYFKCPNKKCTMFQCASRTYMTEERLFKAWDIRKPTSKARGIRIVKVCKGSRVDLNPKTGVCY